MYQVIIAIHVLLGLGIIGLVLMQQGKGADAGSAFGTGASGSVFGAQGSASFLSRTTAIFATLFFSTSLLLAFLSGHKTTVEDIMQAPQVDQSAPAPADIPAVSPAPAQQSPTSVAPVSVPEPEAKKAETPAPAPVKK